MLAGASVWDRQILTNNLVLADRIQRWDSDQPPNQLSMKDQRATIIDVAATLTVNDRTATLFDDQTARELAVRHQHAAVANDGGASHLPMLLAVAFDYKIPNVLLMGHCERIIL